MLFFHNIDELEQFELFFHAINYLHLINKYSELYKKVLGSY